MRHLTIEDGDDTLLRLESASDADNVATIFANRAGGITIAVCDVQAVGSFNEEFESVISLELDQVVRLRDYLNRNFPDKRRHSFKERGSRMANCQPVRVEYASGETVTVYVGALGLCLHVMTEAFKNEGAIAVDLTFDDAVDLATALLSGVQNVKRNRSF